MSLEKDVRNTWGTLLAKCSYPLTGNFPDSMKYDLEFRFKGRYNRQAATLTSIVTNPFLYAAIGGMFLGNPGAEIGMYAALGEGVVRAMFLSKGYATGSIAGQIMTEEEGTTWKQRFKQKTKKFIAKWTILGLLGTGLGYKLVSDLEEYQKKHKEEISRLEKQELTDEKLSPLLYREQSISILEKKIKEDKKILEQLPLENKGVYALEKTFLEDYKQEVKPILDKILASNEPMPTVKFGYFEGVKEPIILDILGMLGLGTIIFGAGLYKRFKYNGVSAYNIWNNTYTVFDNREVGLDKRAIASMKAAYHTGAFMGHLILSKINLLGLAVCFSLGYQFVVGSANSYNFITKQITVTSSGIVEVGKTKQDLEIVLAHESTHYYQDKNNWPLNSMLMEGYARTIERKCAEELAKNTNNKEWLRGPIKRELLELKAMYYTLCIQYLVSPDPTIIGTNDLDVVTKAMYDRLAADGHAKGIALFRIAEHYYGQEVYDSMKQKKIDILYRIPNESKKEIKKKNYNEAFYQFFKI